MNTITVIDRVADIFRWLMIGSFVWVIIVLVLIALLAPRRRP